MNEFSKGVEHHGFKRFDAYIAEHDGKSFVKVDFRGEIAVRWFFDNDDEARNYIYALDTVLTELEDKKLMCWLPGENDVWF